MNACSSRRRRRHRPFLSLVSSLSLFPGISRRTHHIIIRAPSACDGRFLPLLLSFSPFSRDAGRHNWRRDRMHSNHAVVKREREREGDLGIRKKIVRRATLMHTHAPFVSHLIADGKEERSVQQVFVDKKSLADCFPMISWPQASSHAGHLFCFSEQRQVMRDEVRDVR